MLKKIKGSFLKYLKCLIIIQCKSHSDRINLKIVFMLSGLFLESNQFSLIYYVNEEFLQYELFFVNKRIKSYLYCEYKTLNHYLCKFGKKKHSIGK